MSPTHCFKGFKSRFHCNSSTKTFYYHLFCIHAVQSFAVFNQPFLIKVLLAAVWAREGEAIWEAPGVGRAGVIYKYRLFKAIIYICN